MPTSAEQLAPVQLVFFAKRDIPELGIREGNQVVVRPDADVPLIVLCDHANYAKLYGLWEDDALIPASDLDPVKVDRALSALARAAQPSRLRLLPSPRR